MHIQASRNISSLLIFRLSSCDSSPPLKPATGESSNDHKMSYTHPNSISLVSMGYRRWEEVIRKDPFWYFSDDKLWLFNFHPISQNWNILISTHLFAKLKIVLENLMIERRHGQKTISKFQVFHLRKSLWLFTSPEAEPRARDPGEIFETWVFIF